MTMSSMGCLVDCSVSCVRPRLRSPKFRGRDWRLTVPRLRQEQILTVRELAEYLRCHPSTIYRFVRRREVPHFKLGSDIRFQVSLIEKWIEERSGGMRPRRRNSR